MSVILGFDTSNYTTSVAIYNSNTNEMISCGKLLDVKSGERGLRQSDALFLHTKQLPDVIKQAFSQYEGKKFDAVCVSTQPRSIDNSYMPVFLSGLSAATSAACALDVPLYTTSHQNGHALAALYSLNRLDLINQPFLAFHVSGGTTEALYVTPSDKNIINCELVGKTLDLNAGQVIDRIGVKLGLKFPCGNELDKLAQDGKLTQKPHPTLKGTDCCLSGLENICDKMLDTEEKADVARFLFEYISQTLLKMTQKLHDKYGNIPTVYAGGVMRNSIIRSNLKGLFASPEFSSDNAAGVAVIGSLTLEKSGDNGK